MKVYCHGCKHYSDVSWLYPEPGYYEKCDIAGEIEVKTHGSHRNAPSICKSEIKPSEKNANNDCEDWRLYSEDWRDLK